jgi:NAD(P)H-hydrate epimerase
MKLFTCEQIKEIDKYTIRHEPVASIDLMERAAGQLFKWIAGRFGKGEHFIVFAGTGNNGGDGLAIARMLAENRYSAEVCFVKFSEKISPDCEVNLNRLKNVSNVKITILTGVDQFPVISSGDIIIDTIFGSGLTRPADGLTAEVIKLINDSDTLKISVDIPSGLFCEDNSNNSYDNIIKADFTLSFQFPKLSFMFAENDPYIGEWEVLPIGLDNNFIRSTFTPYLFLEKDDIFPLLKERNKFDHKGIFGHGLMIAGSLGKMGAAVLSAGAAIRTGIGLISCHIPSCGSVIMQSSLPEAMIRIDKSEKHVSEIYDTAVFSSIGIGPGLGTEPETQNALRNLLTECKKPLLLDADALNILSQNKTWLSLLPGGSVLTPHLKEFERLTGKASNGFERLGMQVEFSKEHNCVVVLKGAYTSVTNPDGNIFFNSTGNPGMATGGSGDVLTGIILSLLAQGYTPSNAAILGVYLHGLAGDIAAGESCFESIIASDIINCIGKAFNKIRGL